MYTNNGIGKGLGLKQIISIAVIAICILTMVLPWVYVGMKSTDGDNWDMNSLLEDFTDLDVDYYLDIITDSNITDYLLEALSPASARKELKSARNAVTRVANAVKDSKLSPVETASIFTNLAKLQSFFTKYDDDYAFDFSKNTFLLIGAVQWLIILAFVVLGAYCIFADLTGRKSPFLGAMCVYLVLFSLYAVIAIYGNTMAKRDLGDSFILDLAGIRSPSFLHIQFAPIFGSILMIGNFVFWKLNADGSLGAGIENIGKKWCGNARAGQRTPRPADSARSAEMSVPRISRLWISRRMLWTGLSGPAPAEAQIPKKARSVQNAAQSGRLISPPRSLRIPRTLHIPLNLHMPRGLRTPRTPRMPRSLRVLRTPRMPLCLRVLRTPRIPRSLRVHRTPHIPLILRTRLPQSPIARDAVSP